MSSFRGTARLVSFTPRLVATILVIASETLLAGSVPTSTLPANGSVTVSVLGPAAGPRGTALTFNLSIIGPPPPSAAYIVAGATQFGANTYEVEAGRTVTFTASETMASNYFWDFGDGTAATGKSVTKAWSTVGVRTAFLVVTGDGTNTSGLASANIFINVTPSKFKAVIVPGVAHLDDGTTTWGSDVSIANGGTALMNISLAFVPYSDSAASSLDLTQLNYGAPVALSPGASYSVSDVVAVLNGGNNKGTLVIKYALGTRAPLVSARVYFQPKVNPGNISYGSGIPAYEVDTPPVTSGDQYLIGLRSDSRYRFVVTLYNAGGTQGNFELRATDDQGAPVGILDGAGSFVASRKFNNLGPFQQVYLRDTDLFLESDLGSAKNYVLKATSTKGTLLAFGTALDRKTLDLVQITDDSQISQAEADTVSYWVAGVSRYNSSYGAHWRTDLRIFNRGSKPRNLIFQYFFTSDGVTEHVAQVANLSIAAGQLLTYDDAIAALLGRDTRVDLSGSNAGILRIFYLEDDESATRPLIIGSRNYDDEPTGTAGSQLAVYTSAQAGSASQDLFLTGVEDSARYASRIGVFTMDPGPVTGRIVVVAPDGSEVGSVGFLLGGSSPRYGQISLTDPNLNFTNPGKPVSIRFEQLTGGRVGGYAFTVDKVTLDTNFIQALPQN